MDNRRLLEELQTICSCLEVLAEMVGAAPDGMFSTKKLAVLIGYLQDQLDKLLTLNLSSHPTN